MPKFTFSRHKHEQFAVEAMDSAKRELPSTYTCQPSGAYATIRAHRDIARARAHLASIGGDEGPRTRKLWGALGKVERQVEQASNRVARCMRGGDLGRARRPGDWIAPTSALAGKRRKKRSHR